MFPKRTNTEFVQILDRKTLKMRVWERGSGETFACGTGASAVHAVTAKLGLCDDAVLIHLRGGDLQIEWDRETNLLYMTGPAKFVFDGEVEIP